MMASMRNWLYDTDKPSTNTGTASTQAAATATATTTADAAPTGGDITVKGEKNKKRVIVVHCKAGKGRSGTASCSYLIAEEGWKAEDALARFTQRRMRPQFGAGVSIPSQLRYVGYVDRWTKGGKKYIDRPIEILEIHVWGLRNGVRMDVEGFVDDGKKIETMHTFMKEERVVVEGDAPQGSGFSEMVWELAGYPVYPKGKVPEEGEPAAGAGAVEGEAAKSNELDKDTNNTPTSPGADTAAKAPEQPSIEGLIKRKGASLIEKVSPQGSHQKIDRLKAKMTADSSSVSSVSSSASSSDVDPLAEAEPGGKAVIFKPEQPIRIPNSDVNISMQRRNRTHKSMGLTMVTAVAHVWFNAFFEGQGPEQGGKPNDKGVFSIEWDALDGIKGSARKGTRALDRIAVVWRAADGGEVKEGQEINEPKQGEPVPHFQAADWKGVDVTVAAPDADRDLGLRVQSPLSADVSRASSLKSVEGALGAEKQAAGGNETDLEGLKCSGPAGEDFIGSEKGKAEVKSELKEEKKDEKTGDGLKGEEKK